MTKLLLKLPWFLSAPAIIVLVAALALGANYTLSGYFERSFLDEASPLASAGAPPADGGGSAPAATPSAAPTVSAPATGVPATAAAAVPTTAPDPQPTTIAPPPTTVAAPAVIAQGEWRDGEPGHNGSGVAKIIRTEDGRLVLRVEEFSVTNGPDLVVALSRNADSYGDGSLILGDLKATDGNFNYDIPDGTDIAQYNSVVVWCRRFPTTFAYATLEAV